MILSSHIKVGTGTAVQILMTTSMPYEFIIKVKMWISSKSLICNMQEMNNKN